LRTNKAAALAKFLERKLKEPSGLASINSDLLELAVQNAKQTVLSGNFLLHIYTLCSFIVFPGDEIFRQFDDYFFMEIYTLPLKPHNFQCPIKL
jgi:hypothetical protein